MPNLTNTDMGIYKTSIELKNVLEELEVKKQIDVTSLCPKKRRALAYFAKRTGVIRQKTIIERSKDLEIIGESPLKITIQTK